MWSLVEDPNLKYHYLAAFDKAMLKLVKEHNLLNDEYGYQLNMDEANKTLVFDKNGLIFIFNFHVSASVPDYEFMVRDPGKYRIILNSDNPDFGGHGRLDENTEFFSFYDENEKINKLKVYNTNRTALVLKKTDS